LASEYADRLRYSPATDYIVYNGSFWEESQPKAQALAQELTTRQLEEAEAEMEKALSEMARNGALDILATNGAKKLLLNLMTGKGIRMISTKPRRHTGNMPSSDGILNS
jgi:hypothetical protein